MGREQTSVIIPTDIIDPGQQIVLMEKAKSAGIRRAIEKRVILAEEQASVRNFENILDAVAALEQWNTAALAVLGTAYSVFQAVGAFNLANNKLAVFYAVQVETIPLPVSLLTFRVGGAAGNIKAIFDLEQLATRQVVGGYFSEPVVYDPTDNIAVQVTARIATGVLARVQLGAFIIEPKGQRFGSA